MYTQLKKYIDHNRSTNTSYCKSNKYNEGMTDVPKTEFRSANLIFAHISEKFIFRQIYQKSIHINILIMKSKTN